MTKIPGKTLLGVPPNVFAVSNNNKNKKRRILINEIAWVGPGVSALE